MAIEKEYQQLLKKLRDKDPLWKLKEELGRLLMIPVQQMSDKQKKRMAELQTKIENKQKDARGASA